MFQLVNHGSGVILLLYTRGELLKNILNSNSENNDNIDRYNYIYSKNKSFSYVSFKYSGK